MKQYKAIVNKLTGNEFDMDIPQQTMTQQQYQQQMAQQDVNMSVPQQKVRNDTLFMY